jgi:hypothetical protein
VLGGARSAKSSSVILDIDFGGRERARGVERDETDVAAERRQQFDQARLNLDGDRRGAFGEQRQEAGELKRVAETMIAADEDMPAIEAAPVPDPAQMMGEGRIVACGGITFGERLRGKRPGIGITPRPHRRDPFARSIRHVPRNRGAASGFP